MEAVDPFVFRFSCLIEEVLRLGLLAEEIRQRRIVGMQEHAVHDEAAEEPRDEEHQPRQQESLIHLFPLVVFAPTSGKR